ncbi:MAG TPA: oligosaccharide flippase family protein [Rhodothermales bacterium]|nr:oligosaccharide flippase family protein [Rhodothermales bacterium]
MTLFLYLVRFVKQPIVARLLSPSDFGILGLAMVVLLALSNLTSIGIQQIIIQRGEVDDDFMSSAWFFLVLRGIAITALTVAVTPVYGHFFDDPLVERVLYVVAFVPLIRSFVSPNIYLSERQIRFGRIAVYQSVSQVVSALVVLTLAFAFRNVWALVIGMLATELILVALSYLFFGVSVRPRLPSLDHAREFLSIGKFFTIIAFGSFITTQVDNLIIGGYLGTAELGFYLIAFTLISFPNQILQGTFNRVALPAFSRVQNSPTQIGTYFARITGAQVTFTLMAFTAVGLLADPFIRVVYGSEWIPSIVLLQTLTVVGIARGMSVSLAPLLVGTGWVRVDALGKVVETMLFVPLVWLLVVRYGAIGAAIGSGLAYSCGFAARLAYLHRAAVFDSGPLILRHVGGSLLLPLPVIGLTLLARIYITTPSAVLNLITGTSVVLILQVLVLLMFRRDVLRESVQLVFSKSTSSAHALSDRSTGPLPASHEGK